MTLNNQNRLNNSIDELINLAEFCRGYSNKLDELAKTIYNKVKDGSFIYWIGNGGSSSEASHLSVELAGRFKNNRVSIPSFDLSASGPLITCIANDYDFDKVFAHQLQGCLQKKDIIFLLTTSGSSKNLLETSNIIKDRNPLSILLTGSNENKLLFTPDYQFNVPSMSTARIQEMHLVLGHHLCNLIDSYYD